MSEQTIVWSTRGGAAWIRLNRPRVLNALTHEMLGGMERALDDGMADPEARVIVFTGAGRAFCAGADVRLLGEAGDEVGEAKFRAFTQELTTVFGRIRGLSKPTIAAVNGVAVGGGFELCLQCDFRIAATSARIGSAEVNIGQPVTNGTTHLLTRLVGEGLAKELTLTGDLMDATRAASVGLVTEVVDPGDLEAAVTGWVERLVRRAPLAQAAIKECFELDRSSAGISEVVAAEARAAIACALSEDQAEGVRAFKEKRPARWSGR